MVELHRAAIDAATADSWLELLRDEVPWRQDHIVVAGRRSPVPRLQAWIADPGIAYAYSGIALDPAPWTPTVLAARERVEQLADVRFNSVLVNLYRDGRDGVAWHADDEPELGPAPTIGSMSLGATRRFVLRRRADPHDRREVHLHHGDVLVMRPPTQHEWVHQVPRTATSTGPRINLTFRSIASA